MGELTSIDWPVALRAEGAVRDDALRSLAKLLRLRLRIALRQQSGVADADCEDFAQEALQRILARLDQFSGRSRFETWACGIALNTAFTRLRRKHWQNVSLDSLIAESLTLPDAFVVPPINSGDETAQTALLTALRRAIAEDLTERQRAGIEAELRGLPFDQIAALLGANRNAAYKLLHDARRALKRRLAAEGFGPEQLQHGFTS